MSLDKTETETLTLEFEFARALEYVRRPGTEYSLSDYVRPPIPNGFEYECTAAGQTGVREPKWPTTVTGTIADGSVTWTCRAISTNSVDAISSVNTDGGGLTLGADTTDGTKVSFSVSGGTYPGCHVVSCEVTTASGQVVEKKKEITISGD